MQFLNQPLSSFGGMNDECRLKEFEKAPEKSKAPEQPEVIDTAKIVFDFLANNAEALLYYRKMHLFETTDDLTDGQIREIYEHLKTHNKL